MGGRASQELDPEFVAFVDRRAGRYLRAAVLLTGDWHAAEDLVQTCLVKLYRVWPRLDSTTDLDAYLRRQALGGGATRPLEGRRAVAAYRGGQGITGTVDVDQSGRVRRLDATILAETASGQRADKFRTVMEFRDYGARETVSAPPAAEITHDVDRLKSPQPPVATTKPRKP